MARSPSVASGLTVYSHRVGTKEFGSGARSLIRAPGAQVMVRGPAPIPSKTKTYGPDPLPVTEVAADPLARRSGASTPLTGSEKVTEASVRPRRVRLGGGKMLATTGGTSSTTL